ATALTFRSEIAPAQMAQDDTTLAIEECENGRPCVTLVFHGTGGQGSWFDGTTSDLTLEQFSDTNVVIHRTDNEGPTKGLKATYKGHRTGNKIEGTLTWSWPGHLLLSKGINGFHATIQKLPSTAVESVPSSDKSSAASSAASSPTEVPPSPRGNTATKAWYALFLCDTKMMGASEM